MNHALQYLFYPCTKSFECNEWVQIWVYIDYTICGSWFGFNSLNSIVWYIMVQHSFIHENTFTCSELLFSFFKFSLQIQYTALLSLMFNNITLAASSVALVFSFDDLANMNKFDIYKEDYTANVRRMNSSFLPWHVRRHNKSTKQCHASYEIIYSSCASCLKRERQFMVLMFKTTML